MQQGPQDLPAQLERVALGGLAHSANLQWQEVSEEALRGAPEHPETIASLPGYLPLLVIDSVPPGKKDAGGKILASLSALLLQGRSGVCWGQEYLRTHLEHSEENVSSPACLSRKNSV